MITADGQETVITAQGWDGFREAKTGSKGGGPSLSS